MKSENTMRVTKSRADLLLRELGSSLPDVSATVEYTAEEIMEITGAHDWKSVRETIAQMWVENLISFSSWRKGHYSLERIKFKITLDGWYKYNDLIEENDDLLNNEKSDSIIAIVSSVACEGLNPAEFDRMLFQHEDDLIEDLISSYRGEWRNDFGHIAMLTFDRARDAVECCINIQQRLSKSHWRLSKNYTYRFGITIHMGSTVEIDGNMFGSVVSAAFQLRELAPRGGIVFSEEIYKRVNKLEGVEAEGLGEYDLPKLKNNVEMYVLTSPDLSED
jgi:hypothetical protein